MPSSADGKRKLCPASSRQIVRYPEANRRRHDRRPVRRAGFDFGPDFLYADFLYALNHACDDCDVTEPTAARVIKHFCAGTLQSFGLGVTFYGSRRGIDSIPSYPDVIYWLLLNYATDSMLSDAFRAFQRMRKTTIEREEMLARRVRENATLMVGVFDEAAIIAQFVYRLEPNVRFLLQERLN